jgi:TatD DNase family protein
MAIKPKKRKASPEERTAAPDPWYPVLFASGLVRDGGAMSEVYFDTHSHLQDARYGAELDAVIDRGLEAGVTHMVTCGTEASDWGAALALAKRRPCVIPLLGLHPWFIGRADPDWFRTLERAVWEQPVGIGECGLDFALEACDR